MAPFDIPSDGVVVRHESKHGSKSRHQPSLPQVFRLDLLESATKDILRSLKNNDQVRLRGGKKPILQIGKKTIQLESSADPYPSDIFTKSHDDSTPLYFSGKASHRLEVRRAEKDTAKTDEALATLENTLKSIQEERASNETSMKQEMTHGMRKGVKPSPLLGHFLGDLNRSTPGSPFLSASYSPRMGPTSAPLASGMSVKDRIRLDAIRIPLVHLLAVRPMTPKAMCKELHATRDDLDKLLDKVSWESKSGEGKRELKEKMYRELDVWKFPYRSTEDRQSAIDHAIQAFDRTRVEKKDPLWQLLLPFGERGKGKILSKLNFDKPPPTHPTPKPGDEGIQSKNESDDRDHVKARPKKDKDVVISEKGRKDKAAGTKPLSKVEAGGKNKDRDAIPARAAKAESKFKSSEKIIDSDEEAEAADVVLAKTRKQETSSISTVKRKVDNNDHPQAVKSPLPNASAKKTVHKSSLSSVSSSSSNSSGTSGSEKPQTAAPTAAKTLKPQSLHQRAESSGSRISPRPRHNSSPQKPSPLGSSPPTTSTDVENSSSSKASNQSSAPSSPPSGTDMPQTRAGNKYSPIISDKSRNVSRGRSPGPSPAKRKAAPAADERPAKRQQHEARPQSTPVRPLTNGTITHPVLNRPTGPVRTESERSSSPEKPGPGRDRIIEEARRFQKYYKRYKDLHESINQKAEKDRDDKDMSNLWSMHKRLKEMKAEIWANWDKVEKAEKIEGNRNLREMLAV